MPRKLYGASPGPLTYFRFAKTLMLYDFQRHYEDARANARLPLAAAILR